MRAGFGVIPSSLWILATAALVVACSDPTPSKPRDAGRTSTTCVSDADCGADFLCSNNICITNACDDSSNPCPEGYECNLLTAQCIPTSSDTDGGQPTDGGPECTGRCDCKDDHEICVAGKCQAAPTDGSCVRDDQCPLGTICDFSRKCVAGCADTCDCTGTMICNTTKLQCEACSRTNPCPTGQACNANGACETATQCTTNMDCATGQVCKSNVCGFCAADNDCKSYGTAFKCGSAGLCVDNACSDASCQASSTDPKAYCNSSTNQCEFYECIGDSDCFNGDTCNLSTHTCEGGTSTCGADCNGQDCASLGLVCDPASCTCSSTTSGNLCDPANTGLAVKPDCTACDIGTCFAGGCVDAGDPTYQCAPDPFSCIFGSILGLVICE